MAAEAKDEDFGGKPSKIIDKVYLGTAFHAWNDEILKQFNITHIVCCISGSSSFKDNKIKRLMIPMDDRGYSVLTKKTKQAFPFITTAIEENNSNNNNNVLIHCKSSVNRSPTITVAFIMYYKKLNLKDAHGLVEKNHELMCCHHNYMDQLREYDKSLYGKYSTKPDELLTTKTMMAKLREKLAKEKNKEDKEQKDDVQDQNELNTIKDE